ncbi:Os05g0448675 [Oryza sativa Japonica Group]|uniref:Os05g0448675 protein n=1 Tax=Oryza sativa subsp. japonica TaxID=39947 RepID=A0A0P0WN85_ORYSJ|nr:Os05g0448675 [Oryza sativa Japonica Group]
MEPNYSDYHPNSVPFDAYYEHGHGHLDDHGHGHHHLIPAHPEPSYSYGNWSFLHADATATSSSESSSASASSGAAHIVGASGPSASFVRQLHFGGEYYDDDAADISALMEAASISCWTTNGGAGASTSQTTGLEGVEVMRRAAAPAPDNGSRKGKRTNILPVRPWIDSGAVEREGRAPASRDGEDGGEYRWWRWRRCGRDLVEENGEGGGEDRWRRWR